jgi:hypothetical protein
VATNIHLDQYDIDRAEKFIEQIQSIHQMVQEQLEKSQAKYKTRHDKHRVDHSFQVGDEVWLYISKERLKGEGKNSNQFDMVLSRLSIRLVTMPFV